MYILQIILVFFHILGFLAALDAVIKGRTSQGSIAWVVALIFIPYIALPFYWVFGSRKFYGYINARRVGNLKINKIAQELKNKLVNKNLVADGEEHDLLVLEKLARIPITINNHAELLINGEATFLAMFQAIEAAEEYIIVQFYKIINDNLGKRLQKELIAKAKEGVAVYLLYDEIGCHQLPKSYLKKLTQSGVKISNFRTEKKFGGRLRLNFRNHRKIVVIDGKTAFVGGFNISDKYLGIDPKYGFWRDTHVQIEGPAVQCIQLPFISDWYWAIGEVPKLSWELNSAPRSKTKILTLPSGPDDELETCALLFVHALNSAQKKAWIISPYFVPDEQVVTALQLAGMRGVDVRLIIPEKSDLKITYFSSFSFLKELTESGVKIFRYEKGILHEKVMLVDDEIAIIGTSNLDNRSFRINFEIDMLFWDSEFARKVAEMFLQDLKSCRQTDYHDYLKKPIWFKLLVRISRLLAPIQ